MKFEEMNPAPPVTRTRFGSQLELAVDRVQGPPLHVALDSAEVLADEREDEALHAEHEEDERRRRAAAPGSRAVDPVARRRRRRARSRASVQSDAEREPDPLDRLRPEAGEHVQREPREAKRRVAGGCPRAARAPTSTSTTDAPPERTSAFVNFCLPIAPSIGLDRVAPVGVEGAAEVGDRRRR